MRKLIVLALVGLGAQLVDGSLGMGYGVTSSTLLVLAGLTPAAASASVHFSELGTNLASGVAHWRLGNVDWRVVGRIAGPGAIGAFAGATVLSALSTQAAAPLMAAILAALGLYIIIRFVLGVRPALKKALTFKFLAPLGLFAGFIDASGGGGWGPVATPALLVDGRMEPRKVIGSIDTSEFAVSMSASVGFLVGLGAAGINWGFALALLAGGLVAAPLAAYLVRIAPAHLLGIAVGGLILLTNSRTLLRTYDVSDPARFAVYGAVAALTLFGLRVAAQRVRRTASPAPAVDERASESVGV
ncbi:MAG: Sulfate transporter, CysZ-type [uncultured Friedmanniella sp.]|uniref:Probable membrane transporter protein n=1 Tax=uncultured Friedmanniella sp. TaxID=335381 RepID=A0A6J4L9P4_9ACTN|nr:sulfite exporter TauE/SafE family protein [uncultured Friedmanniella sp.]CAA9326461.1 MAG: Sulfate transporter, CysZ-type [uncultured Friedmanniella sp.]